MAKCTECGSELTYLVLEKREVIDYYFDGEDYENEIVRHLEDDPVYLCPSCAAELAYTEQEARRILGKD